MKKQFGLLAALLGAVCGSCVCFIGVQNSAYAVPPSETEDGVSYVAGAKCEGLNPSWGCCKIANKDRGTCLTCCAKTFVADETPCTSQCQY